MYPRYHILLGLLFSLTIYLLFPITIIQASLLFLSSFLIDVDHYLFYIWRKKDFSLKNAYNYHIQLGKINPKNKKPAMMIFHTAEFIILLAILSYFIPILTFILIGLLFHLILDMFHHLTSKEYFLIKYLIIKHKHPRRYV